MSYFPNPFVGVQPTHTAPIDGDATYTSSTTITLSNFGFTAEDSNCYVTYIFYKPSGGNWQQPLVNGVNGVSISASSNVLTVSGAGTPFASGDTYFVGLVYLTKSYDKVSDASRSENVNPDYDHNQSAPHLIDVSNIADTTTHYAYFDARSFKDFYLQFIFGGTDIITVKVATSGETDVGITSATYTDASVDILGAASIDTTGGDKNVFISDKVAPYFRIEYTSNNTSSDGDLKVTLNKVY